MRSLLGLALGLAALSSQAQQPPPPPPPASAPQQLERVTVQGGVASPEARRRASTASKLVIGREELQKYGDGALGDVLRRLPGVTIGGRPGRGGDVRLRGLGGGFTQILVDGERAPAGFSVDQLPPEQVERIEIFRAPTAETGARAVAGTINIVLREPLTQRSHELRLGASLDRDQPQAELNWTRNGLLKEATDNRGLGTAAVSASTRRPYNTLDTRTLSTRLSNGAQSRLTALGESQGEGASLNANARLRWRIDEFSSLHLAPFVAFNQNQNDSRFAQTGVSRFDGAQTHSDGRSATWRLASTWQQRRPPGTRLEARLSLGQSVNENRSWRQETLRGSPVRQTFDRTRSDDETLNTGLKWSEQTAKEHQWVTGLEWETGRRTQQRENLVGGVPRPELAEFGDNLLARTQRWALYTQDEWSPSREWSVYLGLRFEQIATRGDAGNASTAVPATRNTSRVSSPLAHLLWKPAWSRSDQLRASLTRSYRAPGLGDLIARPVVNATYPNGPNPQNAPDRAGNPDLKPELATALEIGWERFLEGGGVLAVNVSARDIRGLIRNLLAQEAVPWDAAPRWVSRPRNLDRARAYALELEVKARADELGIDEPPAWLRPLVLRANLALLHSQVAGIPGPDNRLDQQPRGTLNLGADYRFIGTSASAGFNFGYVPLTRVQQTPLLRWEQNARRVLDAYLAWSSGPELSWRLTVSNAAPKPTLTTSTTETLETLTVTDNRQRSFTVWGLRAEMRF